MKPTISIVIATYNNAPTLPRALQSILDQTFPDYEVIVVNDGSTDGTAALLTTWQQKFGSHRLSIITLPKNGGQTQALQQGLQLAQGIWVARLDADDWWEPDKLRQQMAWLAQNPDVGVLGCAYQNHHDQKAINRHPPLTDTAIRRRLWWRNPFGHSCVIMRRDLLENVGGYDTRIQYGQDLDLWFRLVPTTKMGNLSAILCHRTIVRSEPKQRAQMRQTLRTLTHYAKKYRPPLFAYTGFLEPFIIIHGRWLLPTLILAIFTCLQISSISYGTTINDLPSIKEAVISADTIKQAHTQLQRVALVSPAGEPTPLAPLDQAIVRYKLYSIDADEMVNLMALARINPAQQAFDPHFYMYGGSYLYPLGATYAALMKSGVVTRPTLESLLSNPNLVDALYVWGRLFVLTSVIVGSLVLYLTARLLVPTLSAALALILYLFIPMTIMQSVTMKPHWYALLPTTVVLYAIVRAFTNNKWSWKTEVIAALTLGLAIGSATTYVPFAIGTILAIAFGVYRQKIPRRAVVTIPLIALSVFALTNPFILLNYPAWQAENAELATWYQPAIGLTALTIFLRNSLLPAFGVAGVAAVVVALIDSIRRRSTSSSLTGIAILSAILLAAFATASVSAWHTNTRFFPYVTPIIVLYLAHRLPARWLAIVVVVTLAHATPHVVALTDENNPRHSTRLQAAAWIHQHIAPSQSICAELVPYNSPPFNFARYTLNTDPCRYIIRVEREFPVTPPENTQLLQQFTTRLTIPYLPLVTNHVNPQVSIYENLAAN